MELSWSSLFQFFNPTLFKGDPDIGFFLENEDKTILFIYSEDLSN